MLREPHRDEYSLISVADLDETETDEAGSGALVQSVQKALRALRLFDSTNPEWTPAELSRQSGLRRTTAFRLAKTLQAEGMLALNESTGKYSLGPAARAFAYAWISDESLARMALPHLERLSTATRESVGLTVWNGIGPMCVAHSPSPRPFRLLLYVGQTFMDVANAHSKVLLAFGPAERSARALAKRLEPLTPFTIVDPERYADELQKIRIEGIAYDLQEQQLGVCALAVPVRDFTGEVRASVSVVVSEVRYGPREADRYGQALNHTASALAYDLGCRKQ
ncbi:MAG: IclR family transcriptional regulator [Actinobacteria bacterium]|nr:IclR family transcriptional regulator [Actinomycetota bacterium]